MSGATFTIGTLAKRAGVGVQTVRYYERIGVLPHAGRAKGAYRRYDDAAVARLQFVRRAAALGFTLAETKELLALRAREGAPCTSIRTRAEQKLDTIERKLTELQELRDAVAVLVRACSGDTAVEHCSILAALSEPGTPPIINERKSPCQPQRRPPAPRPASRASKRANAASKTV